jgi:hypothetical protein
MTYSVLEGTDGYSKLLTQCIGHSGGAGLAFFFEGDMKTHEAMYYSVLQRGGTAHEGTRGVLTACSQVLTWSLVPVSDLI